jgi:ABC-type amino acid transport substrate-binding protein
MKNRTVKTICGRRAALLALCLMVLLNAMLPLAAHAKEREQKTVRVGWYESTFCYRDRFGRRCGIAYEYQQRIAVHTGWAYVYVEDSWPNLFQMLQRGEIDLLSDVSLTEERRETMSFPNLPMGSESYYLYIDADNKKLTSDDLTTFNNRKIGVNKGSVQAAYLRDWARKNGIIPQIVELTGEEADSMDMLARGELDGFVSTNTVGAKESCVPVCRIGASDFYFAVNRERPDLLKELNAALTDIQNDDPYFNQKM